MTPVFVITIRKKNVRGKGTVWVVSKPECVPPVKGRTLPVCGDIVRWEVAEAGVSAYLQFTDMYLFENVGGARDLTDDMTAVVTKGNPVQLKMRGYTGHLNRRKQHYYAVWIEEEARGTRATKGAKRPGNGFALGHTLNPPPEINVGP